MHFTRLRRAFWQAFQHGQFSIAKGAAYSSILTLFPAFLVITSALEASHNTEGFLQQISDAVGWVLPPGSRSVALSFFQTKQHHATRIVYSASIVTLLAASGVMISWMDGFRKAYGMANTWGFWRERAIALYLVLLALIPLGFATILVAFGNDVENWVQSGTMHLFRPLILLVWDGVRWAIALLTAVVLMALMYHHGLPKTQSWRRVLPGAVMAAVLWFPATMLFGWYVRDYATYTVVYGSLSAAIALLVWLYIVSVIVLLGAEMNAQVFPKTTESDTKEKKG
ncbi:MAG: YihY/virulence factor BrkB family protein [Candidatus Angelobacter sp.]